MTAPTATPGAPLLRLRDVRTHFPVYQGLVVRRLKGLVRAVDGIDLDIPEGEALGLVGESGCGKSTLARTILQISPAASGSVQFRGRELIGCPPRELRRLRPAMQMVFQDPYSSLNPRMTVYDAIAEPLRVHRVVPRSETPGRVAELMGRVGLAPRMIRKYPHEFSGGQRQRIAIARALALNPALIVADEPVSALDVSVQAQILNLLARLCRDERLTLILISHDLGVVRHLCHRIAVMYLGRIVEIGPADALFHDPAHPYARALISAIPTPDPKRERRRERIVLPGDPPSPMRPPRGCAFHPRCPHANDRCRAETPRLRAVGAGREAACHRVEEIRDASPQADAR